jgi:hypothetical protein
MIRLVLRTRTDDLDSRCTDRATRRRLAMLASNQTRQLIGVGGQLSRNRNMTRVRRPVSRPRQAVPPRLHGPIDIVGRAERNAGDVRPFKG